MKKFYLKAIIFISIVLLLVFVVDLLSTIEPVKTVSAYLTNSVSYINEDEGPDNIVMYINKAQEEDDKEILIIGDSVCRQMFTGLAEKNEDFSILASNGGATLAVQYVLAEEWLEHHKEARKIYLMVLPQSIGRTFDTSFGYQYVAVPLVKTKLVNKLEPQTINELRSAYGGFILNDNIMHIINESPMNKKVYLNYIGDKNIEKEYYHYELADIYIPKIKEMCDERGVEFYVYPCPIPDNSVDHVISLKEEYEKTEMFTVVPYYYDLVYVYDSVESNGDVHFAGDYANQENYNFIISEWLKNQDLLKELTY